MDDGGTLQSAGLRMGEAVAPDPRPYEREEDLAAALSCLEPGAWRQLFQDHHYRVYNYAYVRTGNVADAEDIAANVFVEAVKGIERFQYRGAPVAAWLFRIAHNETVDLLNRRKRMATTSLDHPDAAEGLLAGDDIGHADAWHDVGEAMGGLKQEHRDVLVLRLVEGCSVNETAALLGKTEGAVKVMQMRALRALRARLDK
jgi:RNA polymerase sigma-70 factor (ECF subfamily)